MVNTIKILSMNCRGLQDNSKRKDVFNFLRNKKYSILCLQDTHFSEKDHKIVRAQWGAEIYSSPGKPMQEEYQSCLAMILNIMY